MSELDTIVAIATPPGRGAIGVVRVSGPTAARVARALLGRCPEPRHATLATFREADGAAIDAGLALYFPGPQSFTGEDSLELQGHGGPVVLDALVQRCIGLGCRAARPGEFSERAFLNGKIDVAQAEGVADLIDAASLAAARAAVRSMQGALSARVHTLQAELTALRVRVEGAIDFPDEEVPLIDDGDVATRLARLRTAVETLRNDAHRGVRLVEGLTVVIAGKPNAGKSSLLNRLAGDDVAIVTDLPGTTRDLLRHSVLEGGVPLHLVDTAGLRVASDAIEAEGIRRARAAIARADLVLYVVDAAHEDPDRGAIGAEMAALAPGVPLTIVLNKIDLIGVDAYAGMPRSDATGAPDCIELSARTGAGVDRLRARLRASAGEQSSEASVVSARRRHLAALERADAHLGDADRARRDTGAPELVAEELRCAQAALGEITGEFTSEDLLGEIFRNFCIGK